MHGINKRKGGYSQFYQEDRGASSFKPGDARQANNVQIQDQDPSQIFIER